MSTRTDIISALICPVSIARSHKSGLMKQSQLNESRVTVVDMFVDIYNTDKQYNIIYADPPWRYNQRNNKKTKFGGGVHAHYPTMSMEEIEKLPIEKLAGKNCALFL